MWLRFSIASAYSAWTAYSRIRMTIPSCCAAVLQPKKVFTPSLKTLLLQHICNDGSTMGATLHLAIKSEASYFVWWYHLRNWKCSKSRHYQLHHWHLHLVDNSSDRSDCLLPQDLSLCLLHSPPLGRNRNKKSNCRTGQVAVTDPHEMLALLIRRENRRESSWMTFAVGKNWSEKGSVRVNLESWAGKMYF